MKKLLVVLGLLVLVPGLALAQGTYYVDYYANNNGPAGPADQIVRIINVGTLGNPLTWPATGGICANLYVFDPDQEMIACCAEPISPNELDSAYVGKQLTNNTLTTIIPPSGVVKIVLTPNPGGKASTCDPTNLVGVRDSTLGVVFGTHLQVQNSATYVTETEKISSPLSVYEDGFLQTACSFALYLGSGRGTCSSTVSSGQK